jgi:hypothetical protein
LHEPQAGKMALLEATDGYHQPNAEVAQKIAVPSTEEVRLYEYLDPQNHPVKGAVWSYGSPHSEMERQLELRMKSPNQRNQHDSQRGDGR